MEVRGYGGKRVQFEARGRDFHLASLGNIFTARYYSPMDSIKALNPCSKDYDYFYKCFYWGTYARFKALLISSPML